MPKAVEKPKPNMQVKPKCARDTCHHPHTFHGRGTKPCQALGCKCPEYVEPKKRRKAAASA